MQLNLAPKRELPGWIREHLAREERVGPEAALKDDLAAQDAARVGKGMRDFALPAHKASRINLNYLKFFALIFLLPGIGGLIFSAMVSTDYRESLPRYPSPAEQRMTPRDVHGVMIYQTVAEDERLSVMEYTSVSVFLVGLLLAIFFLEKWSAARQKELETNLLEEFEV